MGKILYLARSLGEGEQALTAIAKLIALPQLLAAFKHREQIF
jgi:hypothetical protein